MGAQYSWTNPLWKGKSLENICCISDNPEIYKKGPKLIIKGEIVMKPNLIRFFKGVLL